MAENKTQQTDASVSGFIDGIEDPTKREDTRAIVAMMQEVSGEQPRMWGDNVVGFGDTHLKYASGREVDWFLVGFSPRKQTMTLYLSYDANKHADLLEKLGKHKTGVGCLYIKKLADVDRGVLKSLIERTVADARALPDDLSDIQKKAAEERRKSG